MRKKYNKLAIRKTYYYYYYYYILLKIYLNQYTLCLKKTTITLHAMTLTFIKR